MCLFNIRIERGEEMEVENSWKDGFCYYVSFKNNNNLKLIFHRYITVPEDWNEETLTIYLLKAFKDITIIRIEYMSDCWFPRMTL